MASLLRLELIRFLVRGPVNPRIMSARLTSLQAKAKKAMPMPTPVAGYATRPVTNMKQESSAFIAGIV